MREKHGEREQEAVPRGTARGGDKQGGANQTEVEDAALRSRLSRITHKILVLSGKGGVGKSSVAACLAVELATRGRRVAVLDIDIHGPSIPRLLGVEARRVTGDRDSLDPVTSSTGVDVMSIGLLLQSRDDAVIWRGPLKYNVIKQLLRDVEWGDLDYLIVDSPPGTGDEPLSVAQLITDADGALIVTTPQALSTNDVRRSIGFVRQLDLPVLGVMENMSGFVCPECGGRAEVFGSGGGATLAEEMRVPFLGAVPIDADMMAACDAGALDSFLSGGTAGADAFLAVVEALVRGVEGVAAEERDDVEQEESVERRIAVPVTGGRLAEHFGHCEEFVVYDTGSSKDSVDRVATLVAPPHQPGLLPEWLTGHGVDVVIAGGLGQRAQGLFRDNGIEVIVGAAPGEPDEVVRSFVDGTLKTGRNACDH